MLGSLGSAKAQCLVRATQVALHPSLPGGEVVVVGTGTKITFVAIGADAISRPTMGVRQGSLCWDLLGTDLTLNTDQPVRSVVARLPGEPRALEAVVELVRRWAELDAVAAGQRTAQQQARRVTATDGVPTIPVVRRTGFLEGLPALASGRSGAQGASRRARFAWSPMQEGAAGAATAAITSRAGAKRETSYMALHAAMKRSRLASGGSGDLLHLDSLERPVSR